MRCGEIVMLKDELMEVESSLGRVKRVCKSIGVTLRVILVLFCLYWLFVVGSMLYAALTSGSGSVDENPTILHAFLYFVHGVVIALLLISFVGIFSDVAKGISPFEMRQVKRLRIIAGLLALYALVDFVVTSRTILFDQSDMTSGYISTTGNDIIPINLAPIFGAAVTFAFSFVFQYGVLLQEFSDETL